VTKHEINIRVNREACKGVEQTTRRTLVLNALLSATKLLLGLAGRSQTLVADAVHSLSDCVTDIGILVGVRYWSAPADERHPYGHWRLESLVTIAMGLSLIAVACGLVIRAWHTATTGSATVPMWFTLVGASLTVVSKEVMFRWTTAKARRYHSSALAANAWHQRSDAISSIPAVVAITTALIFPEKRFIDPIGAVMVSGFILYAAVRILHGAIADIMDESLPPHQREKIQQAVCEIDGVTEAHDLRSRRSGPGFFLDLHVLVSGDMTVRESHAIAEKVSHTLVTGHYDILDVVVHIEPDDA
jgi:cation diffusion facilitator family transporter